LHFPQCCPPTLVTSNKNLLNTFWATHKNIVCKPLDGMGGTNIFRVNASDPNANTIFNVLTENETRLMMAQEFIPAITRGDKRIILINGEPIPYALARMPGKNDWHGNLALGAKGVAQPLSDRDRWICAEVGPTLREKGLYFVGIDVIGDFLTEINVTSPTCIRELDAQCDFNIAGKLFDSF
jgi:glutathione synthase